MKTCSKCRIPQSYNEFYKKKQSKDGYDFWCKSCWRTKQDQRYPCRTKNSPKSKYFTGIQLSVMINNCRKRANIKGLAFNLTSAKVTPLVHIFCDTHYHIWKPYHPFRPSIDRINSKKGYTLDNIQIIWSIENHCKNIYTNKDVLMFCKLKLGIK